MTRRHRTAVASVAPLLGAIMALTPTLMPRLTARPVVPTQPGSTLRWYKGNTHTHTLNSDGDSAPDEVARWYREQGYQFLVLSDHNFLTPVDGLNTTLGADEQFLVIRGEEVSTRHDDRSLHVNGLNIERQVAAPMPPDGSSVTDVLQDSVDAIRDAAGVPHINRPNFRWSLTTDDLQRVQRYRLFEIYNGHPRVNNLGGGDVPGLEEIWDRLLASGKLVYGIAVDDAHVFKRPWDPTASRPGFGWVMVRAERLTPSSIMEALERGDFYASTGVELSSYTADDDTITIAVQEEGDSRFRVRFIGDGGRSLQETTENPAIYRIRGDETYVRAKVMESNGAVAWTQPVMVSPR